MTHSVRPAVGVKGRLLTPTGCRNLPRTVIMKRTLNAILYIYIFDIDGDINFPLDGVLIQSTVRRDAPVLRGSQTAFWTRSKHVSSIYSSGCGAPFHFLSQRSGSTDLWSAAHPL